MDIDAQKKALLELLLEEEGFGTNAPQESEILIHERDCTKPCPVSFAQQRLWFLDQMDPGNPAYNVPGVLTVKGELAVSTLELAFERIVARHEILRTRFTESEAGPIQEILDTSQSKEAFHFEYENLSALSSTEQTAHCDLAIQQAMHYRFDLSQGPLMRIRLMSCSSTEHTLLFTLHHITCDQQSLELIAAELSNHYLSILNNTQIDLPELNIQYGDYSAWQHNWAQNEAFSEQIDYWSQTLANVEPTELPTDKPRPVTPSFAGAKTEFAIPASERAGIEQLAQAHNTTPFTVLLALFKLLVYRHTNQSNITIGTPVANRDKAQTKKLIGFFTNTLVLRSQLNAAATFEDYLEQLKSICADAYAHQDLPFETLVETLQPDRSLNRNPFFEIMFVLQMPFDDIQLGATSISLQPPRIETSKFDLTFNLKETSGGYLGWIEYNTEIFNSTTIEHFAQRFQRLLPAVLQTPHKKLNDFAILDSKEHDFVVHAVNDTGRSYSRDKLLHEVFESQALENTEAVAVTCAGTAITYADLNTQANQLAHYLDKKGVGPDTVVGICLPRGIPMITAVLAVLKAGGTYLPLDPDYPHDRLALMLDDSDAPILITDTESCNIFETSPNIEIVSIDSIQNELLQESSTDLNKTIAENNLLYLIYTSGSTGKPKGTGLSHYALRNLIQWHWENLLTPATTLQFASLSFDASFHEIFVALGQGAKLVIATNDERQDIDALVKCLQDNAVEKTILPVGIFQQWAAEYATREFTLPALKEIITTGEQLIVTPPMSQLLQRMPHCRLHNHYGPSETHVITAYEFTSVPKDFITPPPIGKPLSNTQIYILDDALNPTPPGVFGRLYAGGANLARGYHKRPELTAERFIPSPFSDSGERLYDTGDIARFLPDGNIEFLGRGDAQLKIRGFRVEPGEIETLLVSHESIRQAIVVGLDLQKNRKSLVAYYTTHSEQNLESKELRAFVADQLPDYMVPSRFIHLDAMPITPSGKINRRGLPPPQASDASADAEKALPEQPAQVLMAKIWEALIETQQIGIHENFFDLGGHSLLATRVVSRIRKEFGLPLELKTLFEHPTIESLVNHLATECGGMEVLNEIAELSLSFDDMSEAERSAMMADLDQEGDNPT